MKNARKSGRTENKWKLLVSADVVNILGENIYTVYKKTEVLLEARRKNGLEVNTEETMYLVVSRH
jgi:hypothetical protein